MLGLLANENFERNLKSLNISYEQYVLSVGEFDERILSAYDAGDHTGLSDQSLRPPVTPLTRKQDLPAQPLMAGDKFEPVRNATNNVKQLSAFGRITEPTDFVKYVSRGLDSWLLSFEFLGNNFIYRKRESSFLSLICMLIYFIFFIYMNAKYALMR